MPKRQASNNGNTASGRDSVVYVQQPAANQVRHSDPKSRLASKEATYVCNHERVSFNTDAGKTSAWSRYHANCQIHTLKHRSVRNERGSGEGCGFLEDRASV